MQVLSENVRRLWKAQDVGGIPALAKKCGVSSSQVHAIVREDARPNPQFKTLVRLARYFRVEPWELLIPDGDQFAELVQWYSRCSPEDRRMIARLAQAQATQDDL